MRKHYFVRSFFLILSFVLITIPGCSTTKSIVQKIRPGEPYLKKRVIVLPFIDQAGIGSERTTQMTADFVRSLGKSPHLLICDRPKEMPLTSGAKSPAMETATHKGLVENAENLGMNAVITGVLNPFEITTKKKGIWPFRKYRKIYEISMVVNVVDIISRTLLLTRLETEEVPVSLDKAEGLNEKEMFDLILSKALPGILKHQASIVAKELAKDPWTGKILAVDNDTITINAGKDVGLQPGHCFDVFGWGESIRCGNGKSLNLLGGKIGEIKVTSVMEKHSLTVPAKQGKFLPGLVIRFRH